jgi:hypothetical protein
LSFRPLGIESYDIVRKCLQDLTEEQWGYSQCVGVNYITCLELPVRIGFNKRPRIKVDFYAPRTTDHNLLTYELQQQILAWIDKKKTPRPKMRSRIKTWRPSGELGMFLIQAEQNGSTPDDGRQENIAKTIWLAECLT